MGGALQNLIGGEGLEVWGLESITAVMAVNDPSQQKTSYKIEKHS